MNTLIISCMDRRLNRIIDGENSGDAIVLRNAGANASALSLSIRRNIENNNIGMIKFIPHSDCGAMKVVYGALKQGAKVSNDIDEALVKQFRNQKFDSREELEKLNEKFQEEFLKEFKLKVETKFVELKSEEEKKEHVAVFTYSSKMKFEDLAKLSNLDIDSTYFIEADSIEEVYADLEIAAKNLGIKRFLFIATEPSHYRPMYADMQKFMMKDFAKGLNVELVKL